MQLDPERNPIEVLADEFASRVRRGEHPSISEYTSKYPELAAEIEELFPSIALIEQLGRREQAERAMLKSQAALRVAPLEQLGDFRIIREIGRGGMGVVYEAVQESLKRRVAVKVLVSAAVASEKQLERFRREAKAAARLHHTNIVPVFGVGQQDGVHYYVMQYIDGVGLDIVIAQLRHGLAPVPLPDAAAQRSAIDAARALCEGRFAHGSGWLSATASWSRLGPGSTEANAVSSNATIHDEAAVDRAEPSDLSPPAAEPVSHENEPSADSSQTTPDQPAAEPEAPNDSGQSARPSFDMRYWKSVANIGVQLAGALQYAHSQHVLHRDVKPSNVLLDRNGVAWLTDFGLAKLAEQDDLTHSGDILGTLKYMAPEQFEGRATPQSDIYGLGLTLYELLVLRSPYEASDRAGLIQQVTRGEPVPLRKINRHIPIDLETIVMKAISREPQHRYATAGDMAADLQRFIDERPIMARRISPPERVWRWCRRNPAIASLSAVAALLLILVAVVASVGYVQTRQALSRESEQRAKAERTLGISLEALDRVYRRFAPDRPVDTAQLSLEGEEEELQVPAQPMLSPETALLLEDILQFYDRFAEQDSGNTKLREEAAKANRRVGEIHRRLGQLDEAQAAYQRAIDRYQQLLAVTQDERFHAEIARIYNDLGLVYRMQRKWDEARQANRLAMNILEPLAEAEGASPEVRFELARTYYYLGRRFGGLTPGRGRDRRNGDRESRDQREPSGEGSPDRPAERRPLEETTDYLTRAIRLLNRLRAENEQVPDYCHLLALCYRDRAGGPLAPGVERAIEILEQLTCDYPNVTDYQYDLAETYARWDFREFSPRPDDLVVARQRLNKALQIANSLVEQHPNVPQYTRLRARTLLRIVLLLQRLARTDPSRDALLDEAVQHAQQLLADQTRLSRRFPDSTYYVGAIAGTEELLARLYDDQGKPAAARPLLESSIERRMRLLGDNPNTGFLRAELYGAMRKLADVLQKLDEPQAAEEILQQAEQYRPERFRSRPPAFRNAQQREPSAAGSSDAALAPDASPRE